MEQWAFSREAMCVLCASYEDARNCCRRWPYDRRTGLQRAIADWLTHRKRERCPGFEERPAE